jgi:hypothetical protein
MIYYRTVPICQQILLNGHKNDKVGYGTVPARSVINWPPGFGSVIKVYGSTDPRARIRKNLKELFTDPQHYVF